MKYYVVKAAQLVLSDFEARHNSVSVDLSNMTFLFKYDRQAMALPIIEIIDHKINVLNEFVKMPGNK